VSNGALCVITGLIPINIKIEETLCTMYYEYIKGNGNLFDQEMEVNTGLTQRTVSKLLKDKKIVNTPF
jgi:hypothetical protein